MRRTNDVGNQELQGKLAVITGGTDWEGLAAAKLF